MKKNLFLLIMFLLFAAAPAFSAPSTNAGKIVDILDNGTVTLQLSSSHPYQVGDTLELTYMAGTLPMAIGNYKVTITSKNICLAKPLTMSMPPSKGMAVRIAKIESQPPAQNLSVPTPTPTPTKPSLAVSANKAIEIVGTVTAVTGETIKVKTTGSNRAQAGWFVDLFYVTSQGKELPVGTWKVRSVSGQELTAIKIKGVGNANKQLKAVIYNHKKETAPVPTLPAKPQPRPAPRAHVVAPQPTQPGVQLQGVTPPPPRRIGPNPRKQKPALPPGVTKKPKPKKQPKPIDPETARLLDQLKSNDYRSKRTAAKIISRNNYKNTILYDQVEKELLRDYSSARSKLAVDTMAWMCKALASSRNHKYYDTVYNVSRKARSRKVRKYAKKSLRNLK